MSTYILNGYGLELELDNKTLLGLINTCFQCNLKTKLKEAWSFYCCRNYKSCVVKYCVLSCPKQCFICFRKFLNSSF